MQHPGVSTWARASASLVGTLVLGVVLLLACLVQLL